MKKCQLMTYGKKNQWIDVAHRKSRNVSWFIFIGATRGDTIPDYWDSIEEKIEDLTAKQDKFPESEKIKYTYLELELENKIVGLIRHFRALISYIAAQGYKITCNLTAGIFEQRIALYLASEIESGKVEEVFYINKQDFNKNILFKTIEISDKGKRVLKIMFEHLQNQKTGKEYTAFLDFEFNLTQLKNICAKEGMTVDLPATSRLVSSLVEHGYLKERREGRKKLIGLTEKGLIFCPIENIVPELQSKIQDSTKS